MRTCNKVRLLHMTTKMTLKEMKTKRPKAYDNAVAKRAKSMLRASDKNHALQNALPRYFNIAGITTDGRTISTQRWTDDAAEAVSVLEGWLTPAEEKWHGRIVLATIHDTLTKASRHFSRFGDKLHELP